MRNKIPADLPIKTLVYSKAKLTECAINVWQLEDGFSDNYEEYILADQTLENSETSSINDPAWQTTPIHGKIYELSKASASIAFAHKCLESQSQYKKMIDQYNMEKGAYFTIAPNDGLVLLYIPLENLLFAIDWD